MNKSWMYSLGVGITLVTAIVLSGIVIKVDTNLFNTGITPGVILMVANAFVSYLIFKKHI
jgi:hypothetical protein